MDTALLVDKQINDGRALIDNLLQSGFDVSAAFWLMPTDEGEWRYYVISPVVDAHDSGVAYARMRGPVRAMPQPYSIDPMRIRVIGTTDPLAKDVLDILHNRTAIGLSPLSWRGSWLGNMSIDGAYLYPLPTVNVP